MESDQMDLSFLLVTPHEVAYIVYLLMMDFSAIQITYRITYKRWMWQKPKKGADLKVSDKSVQVELTWVWIFRHYKQIKHLWESFNGSRNGSTGVRHRRVSHSSWRGIRRNVHSAAPKVDADEEEPFSKAEAMATIGRVLDALNDEPK